MRYWLIGLIMAAVALMLAGMGVLFLVVAGRAIYAPNLGGLGEVGILARLGAGIACGIVTVFMTRGAWWCFMRQLSPPARNRRNSGRRRRQ